MVNGSASIISKCSDQHDRRTSSDKVEESDRSAAWQPEPSDLDLIERIFDQWDNYSKPSPWKKVTGMEDSQD